MSIDPIIAAAWSAKTLKPTAPLFAAGVAVKYKDTSVGGLTWTRNGVEAAHKSVAVPLSVRLLDTMRGKGYFTPDRLAYLTGASVKSVVAQLSRYHSVGMELKKLSQSYSGKLQLLYSIP